ncbi:MAG: hypothetical protein GX455_03505 [Phycisphaerae bacterium]|nr:hypothetical protein [Phycisphaerae bacterium]
MNRKRIWILFLAVFVFSGTAPAKEEPFNVDVFFGWGGCYRPMDWTPVEINIQGNLKEPFEGTFVLSARQDELNTMNLVHRFVLTPEIPLHIPLVTKLAFAADKCAVRIEGQRGRVFWSGNYDLWDFSGQKQLLTSVGVHDILIGLIGQRRHGVLQTARQAVAVSELAKGQVYIQDKIARTAPWDWTGYASLDLLILYDPVWSEFHPHQLRGISEWVRNGGSLLLIYATNPPAADNPIAQLLPFVPTAPMNVTIPTETLAKWNLRGDQPEAIAASPIAGNPPSPVWRYDGRVEQGHVFAVGQVGFGRVGVLTFDPGNLSDAQKTITSQFWVERCNAVLTEGIGAIAPEQTANVQEAQRRFEQQNEYSQIPRGRRLKFVEDATAELKEAMQYNNWRFQTGFKQSAGNAVMEHLYNISQMRPLSIWWIIGLLTLLAVLLGPVDYLVLKRMERLPLTWVTSAGWIALFTIGAYFGVQVLRGGSMQVRSVSVMDGIQGQPESRVTYTTGIFAPRSDDYPLDKPQVLLDRRQWWSGITPSQEDIYSYNQQTAGRNLYCLQYDGANIPYSIPINIWTIQCLQNETAAGEVPIDCQLLQDDSGYRLTIINRSASKLMEGYVQLDPKRRMDFEAVDPGETKEFSSLPRNLSWDDQVNERIPRYLRGRGGAGLSDLAAFCSTGVLARTQGIQRYLERGAAVVCVRFENPPIPFSFEGRIYEQSHVQWVRQVIFPTEQKEQGKP